MKEERETEKEGSPNLQTAEIPKFIHKVECFPTETTLYSIH